ncbi:MAG: hypothetical protein RSH26_04530, partial [Clostridia bacterium]
MPSVRILTARPHCLFQPIVREIGEHDRREEPTLLLVPEQFTLQAERELLNRLNAPGFFNVNVLSPSRLYERVLEAAGRDGREPLSSAGRRMAVSQALERLEDNLFRGQSRDIGTKYVFGGQVLGQALAAAQATVENGRHVHS